MNRYFVVILHFASRYVTQVTVSRFSLLGLCVTDVIQLSDAWSSEDILAISTRRSAGVETIGFISDWDDRSYGVCSGRKILCVMFVRTNQRVSET